MAIAEFKEALHLLRRMPLLWVPGLIGGLSAAVLWIILNLSGTFFAGRLLIVSGLLLLLFTTGLLLIIRNNGGDLRALVGGGIRYHFPVLLPQLVIIFAILVVFVLIIITFTLTGSTPDPAFMVIVTFCIMIPCLVLTLFFDTAAVFEGRKVFDSIHRSIGLVTTHFSEVIAFIVVSIAVTLGIVFCLMVVWEAFLYDKLEPITRYTEAQLQAFTPEQLVAIIGPDGMWITAVIVFLAGFLLIPILYSYKACFFKKIAGGPVVIQQQMSGEYDSKGRWYKY